MTNKWNLEVGDLLTRGDEVGIVKNIEDTPYGLIFVVYWTWSSENLTGCTEIPEQLLCEPFFARFQHIKGTHNNGGG
tara:strand:+ start:171 stop:401 length:231 start_codon:yes stop_codon:yes gene_type:complete